MLAACGRRRLKESGGPAFIVEIDVATGQLKPWLFRLWHYDIDQNRKGAEDYRLSPAVCACENIAEAVETPDVRAAASSPRKHGPTLTPCSYGRIE